MKKKMLMIIVLISMILPCIGAFSHPIVYAEYNGAYDFHCSLNYEVSYINDDGSLSQVSCHNSYDEAKNAFDQLDGDYVVRNRNSLSPTKIVAMKSGNVYSYPGRSGSITMKIYELPNFNTNSATYTYLTNHWQMTYVDTYRSYANGTGCVHVIHNGYDGYTDLEYTDLVPSKYINNGIGIWLGGNNTYESESPFYVIPRPDYYQIVQNGNYTDLQFVYHQMYPKRNSSEPVTYTTSIGPAMSFMKAGEAYYSNDSYHFYRDAALSDLAGTGLNYYQFLPLRSRTNVSASAMEGYLSSKIGNTYSAMSGTAQTFIDNQNTYGMNALLVFAMGLHESAYGTHGYATKYYNFFGWSAFDSNPSNATHYNDAAGAIRAQMGYNLTAYLDSRDWRHFSSSLGNKGGGINVQYASDPYWAVKISSYAYDMDKYMNGYNGNLSDYNTCTLAMVKNAGIPVRVSPDDKASILYTVHAGKSSTFLSDYVVIVLGEENGYTKIQSTNAVANGRIVTNYDNSTAQLIPYDFNSSVGYIRTSDLIYLNTSQPIDTPAVQAGEYRHSLDSLSFEKGILSLAGTSHRENIVSDGEKAKTYLDLIGEKTITYELNETFSEDKISYNGEIDLSSLDLGSYSFRIRTEYTEDASYNGSFELDSSIIPVSKTVNGHVYSFTANNSRVVLTVSERVNDNQAALVFADDITINDSILTISGYGLIRDYDFSDLSSITHQIVFYSYEDPDLNLVFDAETMDAEGATNLNDGFDYKYSRFVASIDLSSEDILVGNYGIKLRISNGPANAEVYLPAFSFDQVSERHGSLVHRVSVDRTKNYRLELSEVLTPLEYTDIVKRSKRPAFVSYDTFELDDSGNIHIFGQAMMFYLQYGDPEKIETQIKLVNESTGKYIDLDTEVKACPISYTQIFNSSRDLNYICFEVNDNIDGFSEGDYVVMAEMHNTEEDTTYYDVSEFSNYNDLAIEGNCFSAFKGNTRKRLMVKIGEAQ